MPLASGEEEDDDPSAQLLEVGEPASQQSGSDTQVAPSPSAASWELPPFRQPRARSRVLLRELIETGEATPRSPLGTFRLSRRTFMVAAGAAMLAVVGLASLRQQSLTRATGDTEEKMGALAVPCKKVVCVGTSVTKGDVAIMGGGIASAVPFPTKMQELLGPAYCVHNYGTPDVTVLKQTSSSIWQRQELQAMQNLNPDIVFMQFGARDTLENEFGKTFREDYSDLIRLFKNLPSRPEVYMMSIPPIYPGTASEGHPEKAYGMYRDRVNNLHRPLHHIAKENGLQPPISVFNVFRNKCPDMNLHCVWMSKDGVHPNEVGDEVIATLAHAAIMDDDRCPMDKRPRIPCGHTGITQAQCRNMGCCFSSSPIGGPPQCFHKEKPARATPMQCFVTTFQKTECGYHSDNMEQCMSKGCCYKPSLDGSPWCYHRKHEAYTPPPSTVLTTTTPATTTTATTTTYTTTTVTATTTTMTTLTYTSTTTTSTATTTSTTFTTMTVSSTTSTSTTTTVLSLLEEGEREFVVLEHASWVKPLLVSLGVLLGTAVISVVVCYVVNVLNQPQLSFASEVDARALQEDEERRQLRRLEVDMALRRVEENRRQRELDSMLSSAGFAGVNEAKTKKGMFSKGHTYPLHAAVEANSPEAVQMLLRAGADVNLQDSKKKTALMLAESLDKNGSHQEVIVALQES